MGSSGICDSFSLAYRLLRSIYLPYLYIGSYYNYPEEKVQPSSVYLRHTGAQCVKLHCMIIVQYIVLTSTILRNLQTRFFFSIALYAHACLPRTIFSQSIGSANIFCVYVF